MDSYKQDHYITLLCLSTHFKYKHNPPSMDLTDNTTPTMYKQLQQGDPKLFLPQNTISVRRPREEPGRHLWARLDQTCPAEPHGEAPSLSAVDTPLEWDS